MELGLVRKIDVNEEMQQAYLDYAMSVIIARALPDARDGLKPVHRRILYAMHDLGLRPGSPYKKSARIVGEVLGKYHPHGDEAVYDSMARMAQDFSLRYMLVDGQGNFGSVDGDPPAAMRYTEARLASLADLMLSDIDKQTVNVLPNFDGTLTEPEVLPAALPNLLVNGATGIAVGMATSIPPHNLVEVIGALHYLLERWDDLDEISIDDLMKFVQGPDFPTGGIIIQEAGGEGMVGAYSTGRGRVTVQANAHLEEMERGRSRIIVTELPYMTNKSALIERIAALVREERLEGIADLRDESDRQGMRIVIELSKTADPHQVLSDLYKSTPMQSTFSIIMLALVEGEPRLLSLKQALRVYLEHRLEIVRRRSEYELERARQREHILAGLRIAIQHLDEVIDLIRKSPNAEAARDRLMKRFKLSEIQAQAILDMPLKRLAALERKKLEDEYKEIVARIKELEGLLRSPKKMRQVVGEELESVKERFGDRRRTHIVHLKEGEKLVSKLTASDLTPEKTVWIAVTPEGLISRSLDDNPAHLSGQEAPAWYVQASTLDTLYLADVTGEAAAIAVHAIPESALPSGGSPYTRVTALKTSNPLAVVFRLPGRDSRKAIEAAEEEAYLVTATRQGMVKKTSISELPGPSAGSFTMVRVNEGDQLGWVRISHGQDDILLASTSGMAIRFRENEVRPMGLVAAGVMGIKLPISDELAGMELVDPDGYVFLLASDGSAKRVPAVDFSRQGRYGQGLVAWKLPAKLTVVGMTVGRGDRRCILHLAHLAPKAIRLEDAPLQTRPARGKVIQEVKPGDRIERLTIPWGQIVAAGKPAPAGRGGKPAARKLAPAVASSDKKKTPSASGKGAKPPAPAKPTVVKKAVNKPTAAESKKAETAKKPTTKPAAKEAKQPVDTPAAKTAARRSTAKAPTVSQAAKTPLKSSEKPPAAPAKTTKASTAAPTSGKTSKSPPAAPAPGKTTRTSSAAPAKTAKTPLVTPASSKTTKTPSAVPVSSKTSKSPPAAPAPGKTTRTSSTAPAKTTKTPPASSASAKTTKASTAASTSGKASKSPGKPPAKKTAITPTADSGTTKKTPAPASKRPKTGA